MDELYRDYILEHYKSPRNFGELPEHDLEFHDKNPLCGDEMEVHIRVEDGKIADLKWHGQGCAISQAAASIASEELIGMPVDEAAKLDADWMIEHMGIDDLGDAAQVRAAQPEGPARRRHRRPQLARVSWLLFDLNGTLLDPGDKSDELKQAVTLAMAETLSGGYRPFSDFIPEPPEPKLFDDVRDGLAALGQRFRLAVLTNSSQADAMTKLEATGIDTFFEFVAGTDEVRAFKPDPRVYALGVERARTDVSEIRMIAAHAWDLLGARRAGFRTAYLARAAEWPPMLDRPDERAADLLELADVLR